MIVENPTNTMCHPLNLTIELARLLNFTADVAVAIRMYSAYNQGDLGNTKQFAPHDVMWLSDCLHNFGMLGDAILSGDLTRIHFACDQLSSHYRDYLSKDQGQRPSRPSFERNRERFSLHEGIEIFEAIRRNADRQTDGNQHG